jgi:hypothetical protein
MFKKGSGTQELESGLDEYDDDLKCHEFIESAFERVGRRSTGKP